MKYFVFPLCFPKRHVFEQITEAHSTRVLNFKAKNKENDGLRGFFECESFDGCADEFVLYFLNVGLYPILRRCLLKVQLQIVCQQKVEKIIWKTPLVRLGQSSTQFAAAEYGR